MIPIDQTKLHVPGKQNGNCMNAAFASILEIPIKEIPKFEDMPECGKGTAKNPSWWKSLNDWLFERRLFPSHNPYGQQCNNNYYLQNAYLYFRE